MADEEVVAAADHYGMTNPNPNRNPNPHPHPHPHPHPNQVVAAADHYGMTMAFSGLRLFHH